MNWIRIALVSVAVSFLMLPNTVLAHHGQAVDSDGDGIRNIDDACPYLSDHYVCLTGAGLWKWPAFVLSWTFSAENKINSIKTCTDLSNYIGELNGFQARWTFLAGGSLIGQILKKLPGVGYATILAMGVAGAATAAKNNGHYVFLKQCTDAGVRK